MRTHNTFVCFLFWVVWEKNLWTNNRKSVNNNCFFCQPFWVWLHGLLQSFLIKFQLKTSKTRWKFIIPLFVSCFGYLGNISGRIKGNKWTNYDQCPFFFSLNATFDSATMIPLNALRGTSHGQTVRPMAYSSAGTFSTTASATHSVTTRLVFSMVSTVFDLSVNATQYTTATALRCTQMEYARKVGSHNSFEPTHVYWT